MLLLNALAPLVALHSSSRSRSCPSRPALVSPRASCSRCAAASPSFAVAISASRASFSSLQRHSGRIP